MTEEEKRADNIRVRDSRKEHKLAVRGKSVEKSSEPKSAPRQASAPKGASGESRKPALDNAQYMDGLTVWVNHPSIENPNPFDVMEAVMEAVKKAHASSNPFLQLTLVSSGGPKATVLRCATEVIRKLITDHHISAKLVVGETTHHLQVMPFRGGGNTTFYLAETKIYSENPNGVGDAVARAYGTRDFDLFQCCKGFVRTDGFFVRFKNPPAKLVKEIPLDPTKLDGGFRAFMAPVDPTGKCRNPACGGTKHEATGCSNTYQVEFK
jgi:hypothetical protein